MAQELSHATLVGALRRGGIFRRVRVSGIGEVNAVAEDGTAVARVWDDRARAGSCVADA